MPDRQPDAPIEVEWQLDALDLRPVERWLTVLALQRGGAGNAAANDAGTGDDGNTATAELPAFDLRAAEAKHLFDVYLDTEDWRIGRAGFVLRVRHRPGGDEVTLKDTAPASGGLRRRLEATEPLPPEGVAALGSAGPVGRRVRALAGNRTLVPVLEVHTTRLPTTMHANGSSVAEIALDDTTLSIGTGEEPAHVRRVEVEVDPAWVETLEPLVEQMQRECGLQPATLSKFEVGLLAAGLSVPAPPELGSTEVGADSSVGDVAFAVLRRNVAALLAHEPGTRLGEDIEELHDMRVATRRLRAALALFADSLPVRAAHLRTELGWLADVLGAVRDLDVQLERLDGWAEEVPTADRSALVELSALLGHERDRARRALLEALDSPRYERLVAGFTAMARQGPSRRSPTAQAPAAVVLPELLHSRHRAVTKAARRARRTGGAQDFHRVRIRCKRLRYALEFASGVYEGRTRPVVKSVVRVQDLLGAMQDADVAARRLHDLALRGDHTLSARTVFTMGGIAERHRHEAQRLLAKAPRRLKVLRGPQWRHLASYMEKRRVEAAAPWSAAAPAVPSDGAPSDRAEGAAVDGAAADGPVPGEAPSAESVSGAGPAPGMGAPLAPGGGAGTVTRRGAEAAGATPRVVVPSHANLAAPGHAAGSRTGRGNGNGRDAGLGGTNGRMPPDAE
jgi:CHAD domain-containing protein